MTSGLLLRKLHPRVDYEQPPHFCFLVCAIATRGCFPLQHWTSRVGCVFASCYPTVSSDTTSRS